ncbi:hypothetical protein V6Z11_A07G213600 [Gossypium hirsutum]
MILSIAREFINVSPAHQDSETYRVSLNSQYILPHFPFSLFLYLGFLGEENQSRSCRRRHGIKKYPSKVIRKDSAKKTAKKSRVKCFIKLVNYQHLMPTRYTLDVDLKDVVTVDALQTKDKKVAACKATKERFEERFKTGKNRWFFTKLRF